MSSSRLCRLCVCSYNQSKSLYDEHGQGSEVYDITVKYFDPMILNSQHHPQLAMVICLECWHHIHEFHMYQQSVLQAQTKLEQSVKQLEALIKLEGDLLIQTELIKSSTISGAEILSDVFNNDGIDEKSEVFLPNLDLLDIKYENPFSTDDEKILINTLPRSTRKKYTKRKQKAMEPLGVDENTVKKRERKPKSLEKIETKTYQKQNEKGYKKNKTVVASNSQNPLKNVEGHSLHENGQESQLSSNDGDDDNESDDNQLDPEDFVSSNDQKMTNKRKTKEIDTFIAEWKQELECILCNSFHPNFTILRQHFRREHPSKKCFVSCCQRKFHHRFHIVEHIRLHIDPEAFKCEICGKLSSSSRSLTKHMQDKHSAVGLEMRFECNICQKNFTKKGTLKSHLETHETRRDYQCTQCGKGFPTDQRRKIHERMVHNVDRICDQCGKTIHGIYALKKHILEHAGKKERKWPCDQCNSELNSHFSLKRHKSVAHHDGSTVYICSECGKIAPTETALRSHKKYAHQSERKFKCTICDKGFKKPIVLREHMATHTGEDLYNCPHCPKTFKVNANLHHHRKKAHPKEWTEARLNKTIITKVNENLVSNEVII